MPPPFPWSIALYDFPLIILSAGWAAEMAMHFVPPHRRWLYPAASSSLFVGTIAATLSVLHMWGGFTGLPNPTPLRGEFQFLTFWAAGLFLILSYWRWRAKRRTTPLFTIAWLACLAPLWAAAGRRAYLLQGLLSIGG